MKFMDKIHTGTKPMPRRVLVYGTEGIGKSTFAANAPRPIFIPTEDGVDDIDCASFPKAESFEEVIGMIGELYTAEHDYQTVVIDSLDWLERLIWAHRCRKDGKKDIEQYGYGKGYQMVLGEWREILEGLDALRRDRGMTVVLLAHSHIKRFNNPETEPYDRYSPKLHELASALVREWCNEVLFASYRVHTRTEDQGFNKKRARGVGGDERVIRTVEQPFCLAKNRLGMPPEIPLAWSAYAQFAERTTPVEVTAEA
jgi:hypothetical protein